MAEEITLAAVPKPDLLKISGLFWKPRKSDVDLAALGRRLAARRQELLGQDGAAGVATREPRSFTSYVEERDEPSVGPNLSIQERDGDELQISC